MLVGVYVCVCMCICISAVLFSLQSFTVYALVGRCDWKWQRIRRSNFYRPIVRMLCTHTYPPTAMVSCVVCVVRSDATGRTARKYAPLDRDLLHKDISYAIWHAAARAHQSVRLCAHIAHAPLLQPSPDHEDRCKVSNSVKFIKLFGGLNVGMQSEYKIARPFENVCEVNK